MSCKPPPARNGQVSARAYRYDDDDGLSVTTGAVAAEQQLASKWKLRERYWVDRVQAEAKSGAGAASGGHVHGPTFQSVGVRTLQADEHAAHANPDIVTSASTTVASGRAADEYRHEIVAGGEYRDDGAALPNSLELRGRYSTEPDYVSRSISASGTLDLFDRNLTLNGNLGVGWDSIEPLEAPPGQEDEWPASHTRLTFGAGITQLLSPSLSISAGLSAALQDGQLANPYRRALVRTTLFSEVVPNSRRRYIGFVGFAWHLGAETALHVRQGAYADSWGVKAWIPELAVAKQFGSRFLVRIGGRHYRQLAASFYQHHYSTVEPFLSADPRLGHIRDVTGWFDLEWTVLGTYAERGSLTLEAGCSVSALRYVDLEDTIVSRVPYLGINMAY